MRRGSESSGMCRGTSGALRRTRVVVRQRALLITVVVGLLTDTKNHSHAHSPPPTLLHSMPALSLRDIGVLPPPPPPPGGPTYTAPPPVYVASPPPTMPPPPAATVVNPFVAIAKGVNKTQSIAFAAVFGVLTLLLAVRLFRGVGKHRMVYAFLVIIGASESACVAPR